MASSTDAGHAANRSERRSGEAYSGVRVGRVEVLLDELVELCLALLLELLDLSRRLLGSLFGSCKVRPKNGESVSRRSSRTLYPDEQVAYRRTYLFEVGYAGRWVGVGSHLARLGQESSPDPFRLDAARHPAKVRRTATLSTVTPTTKRQMDGGR